MLRFVVVTLCATLVAGAAHANEKDSFLPPMKLLLEPSQSETDYSFRKTQRDKTINLMLYGFKDQPQNFGIASVIPKNRRALNAFFSEHLQRFKQDYLGPDESRNFRIVTGGNSFTSEPINRGISGDVARMAGVTIPMGKFTVGGGYTWGEENPALMLQTADGLMLGASYDSGKYGVQLSYLASGYSVAGFDIGGGDNRYQSIMLGTSFRVTDRMGMTATAQYRTDDDPLTTGSSQAIFTVGTRWRF